MSSSSSSSSLSTANVDTGSRLAYFEVVIALGPKGEFGLRNSMPWGRIKEDLQYFSRITTESEKKEVPNAIIMGRTTFESMKCKPLPNRLNVVISQKLALMKEDALSCYAVQSYQNVIGSWKVTGVPSDSLKEYDAGETSLTTETVEKVYFFQEGRNDELPWIIVGKMKNGDYFAFEASCDYTGFDCRGGGELVFAPSRESLCNHGLPKQVDETAINFEDRQYLVFSSLDEALKALAKRQDEKLLGKVFVIGGVGLVSESVKHEFCEKLHFTSIVPKEWHLECDLALPHWIWDGYLLHDYQELAEQIVNAKNKKDQPVELHFRHLVRRRLSNPENAYLDLLQRIVKQGKTKLNRTKIFTLGLWGEQIRFDMSRFPLGTTRRLFFRVVVEELLFFLKGKTQSTVLEQKDIKIWKKNTRREFLDKRGLLLHQEGELGKSYPFQWRHFGAECRPNEQLELGQGGIDQIKDVIENIKKVKENPEHEAARRLLVTAWNPTDIGKMALPCCHDSFQFQVDENRLNCLFRMRSSDVPVGLPYNIAFYALLTYMIGHITDLQPGTLVASLSDAHIYANCLDQVTEQLSRSPRAWPKLEIVGTYKSIDDFRSDSFKLIGYHPHSSIEMEMAT